MPTPQKAAVIDALTEQLSRANLAILTDYRGLKVSDLQTLRTSLRAQDAEFRVAKNTLTRIAAERAGIAGLEPVLEGPLALVLRLRRCGGSGQDDLGFRAHIAHSDGEGRRARKPVHHLGGRRRRRFAAVCVKSCSASWSACWLRRWRGQSACSAGPAARWRTFSIRVSSNSAVAPEEALAAD